MQRSQMFYKISVIKTFVKFTWKHLCESARVSFFLLQFNVYRTHSRDCFWRRVKVKLSLRCRKTNYLKIFKNVTGSVKGALSSLRHFLATENPLKTMKTAFYFTLKALFVLKIFWFLSLLFGRVEKRLD